MKSGLNARQLRFVLFGGLLAMFAIGIGLYFLAYSTLKGYASETSTLNARAKVSGENVRNLKKLQTYLENNKSTIERADNLAARGSNYQYQDIILSTITRYAQESGVSILSFNFNNASGTASGGAAAPATSAPAGLKLVTATFTVTNPINYNALLTFIHRIEQSPIKMQISNISIMKTTSDGKDGIKDPVTTQAFTVEVYVNPNEKKDAKK